MIWKHWRILGIPYCVYFWWGLWPPITVCFLWNSVWTFCFSLLSLSKSYIIPTSRLRAPFLDLDLTCLWCLLVGMRVPWSYQISNQLASWEGWISIIIYTIWLGTLLILTAFLPLLKFRFSGAYFDKVVIFYIQLISSSLKSQSLSFLIVLLKFPFSF